MFISFQIIKDLSGIPLDGIQDKHLKYLANTQEVNSAIALFGFSTKVEITFGEMCKLLLCNRSGSVRKNRSGSYFASGSELKERRDDFFYIDLRTGVEIFVWTIWKKKKIKKSRRSIRIH